MNSPKRIHLHRKTQVLDIEFNDINTQLSAEFLRVHSPSAEVRGHGNQSGTLPLHKKDVEITDIESQGNYAIRISFSDGHDSGIYSWQYLHDLGTNHDQLWQTYTKKSSDLIEASNTTQVKWITPE